MVSNLLAMIILLLESATVINSHIDTIVLISLIIVMASSFAGSLTMIGSLCFLKNVRKNLSLKLLKWAI